MDNKTHVIHFGKWRIPGHDGYRLIAEHVETLSFAYNCGGTIILSNDTKPLNNAAKLYHARQFFPHAHIRLAHDHSDILKVATYLFEYGILDLHVVAGSDRRDEFDILLNKYNGNGENCKKPLFYFNSITVHQTGLDRNENSNELVGYSSTKLEKYARENNFSSFKKMCVKHVNEEVKRRLFDDVRRSLE